MCAGLGGLGGTCGESSAEVLESTCTIVNFSAIITSSKLSDVFVVREALIKLEFKKQTSLNAYSVAYIV